MFATVKSFRAVRDAEDHKGQPGIKARDALLIGLLALLAVSTALAYWFALGMVYLSADIVAYLLIASAILRTGHETRLSSRSALRME